MKLSESLFFAADRINSFFHKLFCKKSALRNFEHNQTAELEKSGALYGKFIAGQSLLKNLRFGVKDIAYGGCGIIAIHNILVSAEKEKPFYELVYQLESHALISGLFGISPYAVCEYLEKSGFKVHKIHGRKNIEKSQIGSEKLIFFYFRKNLTAHFAAGIPAGGANYIFFNSHLGPCSKAALSEYTKSLFENEKPIFVCLYTVK